MEQADSRRIFRRGVLSDVIQQEDIKVCELAQRGLRSLHYQQGRLSVKRENGVHHFHGLLAEYLASAARAEETV